MNKTTRITVKDVKELLQQGKSVKVKSKNGQYAPIIDYIEKGTLPTYETLLENKSSIKTSAQHMFFTNAGWVMQKNLTTKHLILCDDNTYQKVVSSTYVGEYPIVDITVDKTDINDQCYFGNGMLNHNSGKSLIIAHAMANTQKKGGLAVYIDTENALSEEFLRAVGVDVANMLYIPLETIEDAFEAIENIIETVRKSSKNRLVTIALDSVSAATTKLEQDADYDKDGWATAKAIIMSKAMRKITNIIAKQRVLLICTSQLREKMGVMFGDKYTTSGGKALGFHASCRVRLKGIGKLKSGSGKTEQVIGVQTEAQIIKNRMGPPFKKATFEIYFNSGINDIGSWFTLLKDYGILKQSGNSYTIVNEDTGEELKFMSKDWRNLLETKGGLRDYCYKKLCDIYIMKYHEQDLINPDEVSMDGEELID